MKLRLLSCVALGLVGLFSPPAAADSPAEFFETEIWGKIGERTCLQCHKIGGEAEDSRFVLSDLSRSQGEVRADDMRHNREAFANMAKLEAEGHQSRLLLKAVGKLDHGGKEQIEPDSEEYRLLADFVRRVNTPASAIPAVEQNARPHLDGVLMLDDRRLLRRVTLSLAGRLPTDAEQGAVASQEFNAMPTLLDAMMKEDAFFDRLREGFEDIFLTLGLEETDNSSIPLSYEHFGQTRHWAHSEELVKHIADEKERQEAHRKINADYNRAMRGEPMKLIEHIVRNDRPFTEIVTADYIMVSPYTARGYGIYEEVKSRFKNSDDPFEFIPVKLKALISPNNHTGNQESATGFYPHAGLLSTFHYLRRYPTTETNRNRLRARMFYRHFLGVDALALAARVSDAAAVSAKYKNPTMEATECVVCHKSVDPVAGLFQDYWTFDQGYGRRKEGWFDDMFAAGFEGEDLPSEERWRALQWLGERTAKDPRFAAAMVEHVYYILTGRKTLLPPKDLDDPLYAAKRRGYQEQRKQIDAIAVRFAEAGFNLKVAFKEWILSDFYRADGLATVTAAPERIAELDDVGLVRMLAPEQLERKLAAVFGQSWGKLDGQLAMLYGGIDSKEVTERASDPSGAMGAIQRILSNDVACKQTALDFSRPPAERRLFPNIEPDVLPGSSLEADARIREAIVYLHQRVLGRYDTPDSPEVDRTFHLFAGIVGDAAQRAGLEPAEAWACRQGLLAPVPDPHYTVRAWRAVVTYLLRQQPYHDDFVVDRIERTLRDQANERAMDRQLPRLERAHSMLYAAQLNSKSLSRVVPWIPATLAKDPLSQCADIALASFKAGVAVSANLSHGTFDSHTKNDTDQMARIPELLAGVAYLIRRAEELKIREKVVVVMQSEMGRTPTYNEHDGKDHWSVGSIMFIASDIRGNRVIGATDEQQLHVPLDPQTLATDKDKGIRVRPEHIHEALRQLAGIADHPHSKKFPLGVAPGEQLIGLWD